MLFLFNNLSMCAQNSVRRLDLSMVAKPAIKNHDLALEVTQKLSMRWPCAQVYVLCRPLQILRLFPYPFSSLNFATALYSLLYVFFIGISFYRIYIAKDDLNCFSYCAFLVYAIQTVVRLDLPS